MGCWQPLKADSFLALAADFLKKGNKFAVNEQNLLGLARFVKDACQQNEPLKKTSTWEVCRSSPVFSVNTHASVLKAHFLDVTFTATTLTLIAFTKNVLGVMFLIA